MYFFRYGNTQKTMICFIFPATTKIASLPTEGGISLLYISKTKRTSILRYWLFQQGH